MSMQCNARNLRWRWRQHCPCCKVKSGRERKRERRLLKRRERQAWKNEIKENENG